MTYLEIGVLGCLLALIVIAFQMRRIGLALDTANRLVLDIRILSQQGVDYQRMIESEASLIQRHTERATRSMFEEDRLRSEEWASMAGPLPDQGQPRR
jgi:hypothetical protein